MGLGGLFSRYQSDKERRSQTVEESCCNEGEKGGGPLRVMMEGGEREERITRQYSRFKERAAPSPWTAAAITVRIN